MQFDVISAIHNRISTKEYLGTPLKDSKRDLLEQFIAQAGSGPFHSKTKFYLTDIAEMPSREINQLHLPKDIKHAFTFIIGTVMTSEEYNLEDYGYVFESIILFATSLQLGTAWLASKINRNRFAELVKAKDFELIPCISPVGLPAGYLQKEYTLYHGHEWLDFTTRKPSHSLFFEWNFANPIHFDQNDKYQYALEMVRLGPSIQNKQPWRIVHDPISHAFHFYIEHSLPELYLSQYEQVIDLQRVDMGVAMYHFEHTLQHFAIEGKWRIIDPNYPLPNRNTEYVATWIP